MIALAILGLFVGITGIVCVNRAETPDGAMDGMLLTGVGVVLMIIAGIMWLFG
jgi:hypothetical protein